MTDYNKLFADIQKRQLRDMNIYAMHKQGKTQEQIAAVFGMTRQRVAQIIKSQEHPAKEGKATP
jgi:transcriptional regulator